MCVFFWIDWGKIVMETVYIYYVYFMSIYCQILISSFLDIFLLLLDKHVTKIFTSVLLMNNVICGPSKHLMYLKLVSDMFHTLTSAVANANA